MSTTDHYDYDYAFEIVQKLPPEQRERLAQSVLAADFRDEIESRDELRGKFRPPPPRKKRKLSREEYAQMLLRCPVMTDEEYEEFEKARKEFRDEFNRRLGYFGPD